jgi:hypothetical protein
MGEESTENESLEKFDTDFSKSSIKADFEVCRVGLIGEESIEDRVIKD